MSKKEDIVAVFAVCFRSLSALSRAEDNFFVELSEKETDKLLSAFIKFLKYKSFGGGKGHVAQSQTGSELISQIKKILELLAVFKHLKFLDSPTSLLLERNLLLLEKSALESGSAVIKKPVQGQAKAIKKESVAIIESAVPAQLNGLHKQILEMIKGRDRVLNTDVFSQFPAISRRTMKRRLSEMIQSKSINRFSEGKKVYYTVGI